MKKYLVKWTDLALEDLDSIYSYISKNSKANAKKLMKEILSSVDELVFFPRRGRVIPIINNPILTYFDEFLFLNSNTPAVHAF